MVIISIIIGFIPVCIVFPHPACSFIKYPVVAFKYFSCSLLFPVLQGDQPRGPIAGHCRVVPAVGGRAGEQPGQGFGTKASCWWVHLPPHQQFGMMQKAQTAPESWISADRPKPPFGLTSLICSLALLSTFVFRAPSGQFHCRRYSVLTTFADFESLHKILWFAFPPLPGSPKQDGSFVVGRFVQFRRLSSPKVTFYTHNGSDDIGHEV